MKQDIANRNDIKTLINAFYDKIKVDDEIGYFFTEVAMVNWEKHLPVMYDFWENILFNTGNYTGNPMAQHQALNNKSPMKTEHFHRWLKVFNETVDANFDGEKAETIKLRATNIAIVMQVKILK